MNPLHMPEMLFSPHRGWDALIARPPAPAHLFLTLVLPFSLLPPALLLAVGHEAGAALLPGFAPRDWQGAAALLLAAELLTVPAMAVWIGWLARLHGERCAPRDAWTLAALAPIPLWLSSLALLRPEPAFVVACGLLALAASAALIVNGVRALFHESEPVVAAAIAHGVLAAGLLAWVLLLGVALLF
jgi:hypothetical protein